MFGAKWKLVLALSLLGLAGGMWNVSPHSATMRSVNGWTPFIVVAISGLTDDGLLVDNSKCENCNGTGVVGDGTIELKCEECDGTGKRT